MTTAEISPEALNAYYNATANLMFPFGTTDSGETLHVIYVYAVFGGTILEVRWNPSTSCVDSMVEFPPSHEATWNYQDMIAREGRLLS